MQVVSVPINITRGQKLALAGFAVGIIARLYLAYYYYGNFDQESYEIVAGIMRSGGNIYAETTRYNYGFVWSYLLLAFYHLSEWLYLPFHFIVRGALTGVDILVAVFVGMIASRLSPGKGASAAVIYILNPVSILITGYHGQFENLASLPLLLAVYMILRLPSTPRRWLWLLGVLSLLIKHITLFGVWMLFLQVASKRKATLMMAAAGGVFLLSFLPYLPEGQEGILQNVLLYRSNSGQYGLGLLPFPALTMIIFLGSMAILPVILKRMNNPPSINLALINIVFLLVIPGMGVQYFVLPLAWGALYPLRGYWIFTTLATIFILSSGANLQLINFPPFMLYLLLLLVWWSVLVWVTDLCRCPRIPILDQKANQII